MNKGNIKGNSSVPLFSKWLLYRMARYEEDFSLVGDLLEEYRERVEERGIMKAGYWYWVQVLRSLPKYVQFSINGSIMMFANYFKVALRNMLKNKVHSFINIFGLSIGLACSILIFMFVRHEYSYDNFHEKYDTVFRVWERMYYPKTGGVDRNASTPIPLAPTLVSTFPEIANAVRLITTTKVIKYGDNANTERIYLADPAFFQLFSFPIIQGNKVTPLDDINALVMTEKMAKKYFGEDDPIGKNVEIQLRDESRVFTVTAVVRDIPDNSSLAFDFMISYARFSEVFPQRWEEIFSVRATETYIELPENVNAEIFAEKIQGIGDLYRKDLHLPDLEVDLYLQPLHDIHMNASVPTNGIAGTSAPMYSYILSGIGMLILFIACINFMTLSIGRSANRAKEVSIRKVVGAFRSQLTKQYLGEALLTSFLSLLLGILVARFVLPVFNELSGKDLIFSVDLSFALMLIVLVFFVGIAAGSYPSIFLSRFSPAKVLKGSFQLKGKNWISRNLVVFQFSMSVFLIVSTFLMNTQLNYLNSLNLGFDKERLIQIPLSSPIGESQKLFETYRNEIAKNPEVLSVSATYRDYGGGWTRFGFFDEKKDQKFFFFNQVDYAYLKTMGIALVNGRDFSTEISSDFTEGIIVNETFVDYLGWEDPLNAKLPDDFENHKIIGVVKDFHFSSLHRKISPLALTLSFDPIKEGYDTFSNYPRPVKLNYALVRIGTGEMSQVLEFLEQQWKTVAPGKPFEMKFVDETIQMQYAEEQQWGKIINYASMFAIIIACLGLFGLATVTVEKRIKEVGIRKVLGASITKLISLLSLDLLMLIFISNMIAWPVSYYVIDKWLQGFAYRADINIAIFGIAALGTIGISIVTIGYHVIKAALSNPVQALKYE